MRICAKRKPSASEIFLRRGDMCFRRFALVKYRPRSISDEMQFRMLARVLSDTISPDNYKDVSWIGSLQFPFYLRSRND